VVSQFIISFFAGETGYRKTRRGRTSGGKRHSCILPS
jgi:hypothetical protein